MATGDGVLHLAVDDLTVITCHKAACHCVISKPENSEPFSAAPDASLARQAGNEASVAVLAGHIDLQGLY